MTPVNNKTALRTKYRALRKQFSAADLLDKSRQIVEQIKALDLKGREYCHVFITIERLQEIMTQPIINYLQSIRKKVVVSKTISQGLRMQHFLLTPDTVLEKNSYHIPEPQTGVEVAADTIDLVLVPLLAYDVNGNRVGYGKGYYDIFLSECRPDTLKVGLSLFEPEQAIVGISKTDVRLDACITPTTIYTF